MAVDDELMKALQRQMLEDLGEDRRDEMSAPSTDNKGRDIAIDHAQEAALLAAEAKRRQQQQKLGNTWFDTTNFSVEVGATPFMNGQAHRARLRETIANERPSHRDTHTHHTHRPGHQPQKTSHTPSRQRAPSPRAAGTVRFVNGQRVIAKVAGKPLHSIPLPSRRPQPQPPHLSAPAAPAKPTARVTAPAAAPRVPIIPSQSAPKMVRSTMPAPSQPMPQISRFNAMQLHMMAVSYASGRQADADKWLAANPSQASHYWTVRKQLVNKAIAFMSAPDSPDAQVYYETHGMRKWILVTAIKLYDLLKQDPGNFQIVVNNHEDPDIAEAVQRFYEAKHGNLQSKQDPVPLAKDESNDPVTTKQAIPASHSAQPPVKQLTTNGTSPAKQINIKITNHDAPRKDASNNELTRPQPPPSSIPPQPSSKQLNTNGRELGKHTTPEITDHDALKKDASNNKVAHTQPGSASVPAQQSVQQAPANAAVQGKETTSEAVSANVIANPSRRDSVVELPSALPTDVVSGTIAPSPTPAPRPAEATDTNQVSKFNLSLILCGLDGVTRAIKQVAVDVPVDQELTFLNELGHWVQCWKSSSHPMMLGAKLQGDGLWEEC